MVVSADTLRLAVIKEVTHGQIPGTPNWLLMRTTGEGLTFEHTTTSSEEMGGLSRGKKDEILTGGTVTGEVNFELSDNDAFEMLLAAVMGSQWGSDPHNISISADQVYDLAIKDTFSFEKRFTIDDDPGNEIYSFQRFTGCLTDTLTLSIAVEQPISGTFGFVGEKRTVTDTEVLDAVYLPAGTSPVMTAPQVTSIELLDTVTDLPVSWLGTSCFTNVEISISNNARAIQCIGTFGAKETNLGQLEVGINGTMYFAANDPLHALDDQTPYTFKVTCEDAEGNQYTFRVERAKFTAFPVNASGPNTDVIVDFSMSAFEDEEYPITIMAERVTAVAP